MQMSQPKKSMSVNRVVFWWDRHYNKANHSKDKTLRTHRSGR